MIRMTLSDADLKSAEEEIIRATLRDLRTAVDEETRGLEKDLEGLTRMAVRGRLWRAWKSETFPRGGGIAREPGGEVYVSGGARSQGAMVFQTESGRISAKDGGWLAIPTKAAGRGARGRSMTVREWEARHGEKLDMVYTKRHFALLVADGSPTMAARNSGRRIRRRRKPIVIFVLIPFVGFRPSFAIEPVHRRREASLAGRIARSQGTSLQ